MLRIGVVLLRTAAIWPPLPPPQERGRRGRTQERGEGEETQSGPTGITDGAARLVVCDAARPIRLKCARALPRWKIARRPCDGFLPRRRARHPRLPCGS